MMLRATGNAGDCVHIGVLSTKKEKDVQGDRNVQGQVVSVGLVVGICVTLAAFTALAGDDSDRKKMDRSMDIAEMKAAAGERFRESGCGRRRKVTPEEFAAAGMARGEARGEGRRWREARERRGKEMRKRKREGMREQRRQARGQMSEKVFDAADGDADGKLSKEEFGQLPQAARSVAQRRAFDRIDADGGWCADRERDVTEGRPA